MFYYGDFALSVANVFKETFELFKGIFDREERIRKHGGGTFIAPCGTVVTKCVGIVEVEEGKEMTKMDMKTGKLYWPSDGSYAEHMGIRDIPNYKREEGD